MLAGSATQKTLSISSPKQFGTIFKRNLTLEDQRLKSLYIKDKETMFEEIQQLKQEKNTLLLTVR
jgi:aspartate/tyrosine/aromatic aminotransferase